jgi:hypothetical protein
LADELVEPCSGTVAIAHVCSGEWLKS